MCKKVLILEDEENIRKFVVINLNRAGYETVEFDRGEPVVEYIRENDDVAIAVLDVMLPDITGFEVCRRIRGLGSRMGIIMLTAMGQEADRVNGFMTGADDYVVKPFSVAELVARVDALYRRIDGDGFKAASDPDVLTSGDFSLNLRSRELSKAGRKIEVTQVEFLIISTFLKNVGRALSREEIMKLVWGENYQGDPKIVDVNMRRLRIKIEDDAAQPKHIMTIWGFGYKWEG
ncbi:MAG: response regulator transcription factor [Clostridia bacterium]|nr:response regulator transcription factor [Clostridia bacterium]MBQ5813278.1 response regulator transcription factor [Clostridia bacterium]